MDFGRKFIQRYGTKGSSSSPSFIPVKQRIVGKRDFGLRPRHLSGRVLGREGRDVGVGVGICDGYGCRRFSEGGRRLSDSRIGDAAGREKDRRIVDDFAEIRDHYGK